MNETPPVVWILADGRAGNRSQCLGIADVLGLPYVTKEIRYGWLGSLPNTLLWASFVGLATDSRRELVPPWPDIVIGAGRRVAPVARRIKNLSGGRTFAVQVMDPGMLGRDAFDLVCVPRHDLLSERANVLPITGAPHSIRPAKLAQAAAVWRDRFAHLPKPWFALLVGGKAKGRALGAAIMADLGQRASAMAKGAGGSLLVTSSRRTSPEEMDALISALSAPAYVHRWDRDGENPYLGYLALADAVIVTGESVSMCSEACATTGPVYIYARDDFVTPKYARLHAELYAKGLAKPLVETSAFVPWTHAPLNAADAIAAEIRKRFIRRA